MHSGADGHGLGTASLEASSLYRDSEELLWWYAVADQALACLPENERLVVKQAPREPTLGTSAAASLPTDSVTLIDQSLLDARFTAKAASLAAREKLVSLHHILKGLKTLSVATYTAPPPADVVVIDYADTLTFNAGARLITRNFQAEQRPLR